MRKVLILYGPTGIGKNNLALNLSKLFNKFSILNSDSRQYYKNISLSINSPVNNFFSSSFHYGYSIFPLNILFNCNKFINFLEYFIKKITYLNQIPIIVGGTGLYLNLWLNKNLFNFSVDYFLKKKVSNIFNNHINIINFLQKIEFNKSHDYNSGNLLKLIRILELILINNESYKNFFYFKDKQSNFKYIFLFLYDSKKKIFSNIKKRIFLDFDFLILNQIFNYKDYFLNFFIYDKIIGINSYLNFRNNSMFIKNILNEVYLENLKYIDQQEKWFRGKKDCYFLNVSSRDLLFQIFRLVFNL